MSDENEDGFTLELTRRRALGALLTIGAGSAAAGAGTFALFSDTEESTGNTISAGTLDLGSVSGTTFTVSDLMPTVQTDPKTITTTYNGSTDADLDIWFSLSEPSETTTGAATNTDMTASEFASVLNVNTSEVAINPDGENSTNSLTGSTLDALQSNNSAADYTSPVTTVSDGDTIELTLQFTMQDVGNQYQADGVNIDVTFGAQQQ